MDGKRNNGHDRNHVKHKHDFWTYTGDGRWPEHLWRKDRQILNRLKRRQRKQETQKEMEECQNESYAPNVTNRLSTLEKKTGRQ